MKTIATSLSLLLLVAVAYAAPDRPTLPKTPLGFDEGKAEALKNAADEDYKGDRLLKELWRDADLTEMAQFVHAHLTVSERVQLDSFLGLEGALAKSTDLSSIQTLLTAKKLNARAVVKALAKMHGKGKFTLLESIAWLYQRDFNFQLINAALDGQRIDAIRLRAELRKDLKIKKTSRHLFERGIWEFNLNDGREEKGGHYDGAQLVDALLELGWNAELFAHALGKKSEKELSEMQRDLIKWKDPALLWQILEFRLSERELFSFAKKYYKKQSRAGGGENQMASLALRRLNTVDRWFRTGGGDVLGVYSGPWPNSEGLPKPPTVSSLEIGEDVDGFAKALGDPLWNHFSQTGDTVTIVAYKDGSARAFLHPPKGVARKYRKNTPLGGRTSKSFLYEGRVSIKGESALLNLVFGKGSRAKVSEIELADLELAASGALLSASIDDGTKLTPILLRRVSQLVEVK